MIRGTRSRASSPSRAGGRRSATIAGWCSIFLLAAAFAAMPLTVSAHDGGKGSDDRTAQVERHGNDGPNHDVNDDRGNDGANLDAKDDHGIDAANHDASDDRGQDAQRRVVLLPVPVQASVGGNR